MHAREYVDLEMLRTHLLSDPPELPLTPQRGDFDLNPAARPAGRGSLLPAAVLVPIVARPEPTVLFTKRAEHLTRHPGQVSFPGGVAELEDASLTATALRELEEETGITAKYVSVAGYLEPYETVSGFAVLPVVGLLSEGFALRADEGEVESIFEVPLSFLLHPASLQEERREFKGISRRVYAFQHGSHNIWGATASILVNLRERLA